MIKALLVDLNGTLYFKGKQIPNCAETIDKLRSLGYQLRFTTNTDSKTTKEISSNLHQMGFEIPEHEIVTPLVLASMLVKEENANTFCILPPSLRETFNHTSDENEDVRYVIVGDPKSTNYNEINMAFRYIKKGASLIALQGSSISIEADGVYLDTGAFAKMLSEATNVPLEVLGKPSKRFFTMVLNSLLIKPREAIIVGDDVLSDHVGALNVGARSTTVQTGKFPNQVDEIGRFSQLNLISSFANIMDAIQ